MTAARKWLIAGGTAGLLVLGAVGQAVNLVRWYHHQHHGQPVQWGVTFSAPYAESLGLDPHQTLTALTDQLGVKHLRLMSYWDQLEPRPGQFDFSQLDWQLDQARTAGADVSMVIGERQPRWPECHQPDWVTKLNAAQQRQLLTIFLTKTVNRYKKHNEITEWQLENEPLNSFGQCPAPDRRQLASELAVVRRLDPGRPVSMTASDEMGVPAGSPRADHFGLSVYFEQWAHLGPWSGELVYSLPAWWQTLRAAVAERWLGQSVYIHELQAEPWGPAALQDLPVSQQLQIFNAKTFTGMTDRARATGIPRVYLWGGEWWYWLDTRQHEPSLWQAAGKLYR